ncbi:MAG TPA: hypothetical protein DCE42_29200 [Myxococcales bacterium]|nr:hypothetical protein [Deltaproteobacteria bacterium]MBU53479.1 hypothetical protein [Deltaproteobacteria bacterium]HAA58876.1 hypothetical protein [Myxococcales bacterium]|tara:strand:- start:5952 stop:6536 length:585 start_codon:yes stop_codon:yes gene_type:complete
MDTKQLRRELIQSIPVMPYEWKGHGVTRDIKISQNISLRKSETSYCSGVVFEFLYLMLVKLGKWDALKESAREELFKSCYVRTDLDEKYFWGLPVGLISLGLAEAVEPEDVDEDGIFFGQFYDWRPGSPKPDLGHAVVCLKQWENKSKKPALWTFSADDIALHKTGEDYWSIDHPKASKTREWYIAKMDESLFS